MKQLANASVSQVEIERGINHVTVTVHTAKPGIVIGKGGANVELLRNSIGKLTDKKVKLEIKEVLQPELDAVLVAQSIAGQLERRIAFRKAVKQGVQRSIKAGAKGVKIQVRAASAAPRCPAGSGTRKDAFRSERCARTSATAWSTPTTYGRIGVKVWIYRARRSPIFRAPLAPSRARRATRLDPGQGPAPAWPPRLARRMNLRLRRRRDPPLNRPRLRRPRLPWPWSTKRRPPRRPQRSRLKRSPSRRSRLRRRSSPGSASDTDVTDGAGRTAPVKSRKAAAKKPAPDDDEGKG